MTRPAPIEPCLFAATAVARTFFSPLLLLVGLLLGGCATPQSFVPLADVRTAAPDGVHGAAEYSLDQPAQRGHVQVWSRGAYRDDSEGPARTIVHIGFSLQNEGTTPLRLNEQRLFLEDIGSSEGGVQQLAPSRIEGNVPVAPSATGNVDAYFTLPTPIWPGDIFGYRVAWALAGDNQARVEHTTFESTRLRPNVYFAYDYYPYYPWGWGWYYPWRPYPVYAPYYYRGAPPVYRAPAYLAPRVLARPRAR